MKKNLKHSIGICLLGTVVAFVTIANCERMTEASIENDPNCTLDNLGVQCNFTQYTDVSGSEVAVKCVSSGTLMRKCVNKQNTNNPPTDLDPIPVYTYVYAYTDAGHTQHGVCYQVGTSSNATCSSDHYTDPGEATLMNVKVHKDC